LIPADASAGPGLAPPPGNWSLQTLAILFFAMWASSYLFRKYPHAVVQRMSAHPPTHAHTKRACA